MAKQVATKEVVFAAADAFAIRGIDPTTILVQERTGGSYTTVKRLLDEWKEKRSAAIGAIEVPAEVETRGSSLIRELYAHALRAAQASVAEPIESALRARDSAVEQLAGAEAEVARLEGVEQGLAGRVDELSAHVRQLELTVATLQATVAEKSAATEKLESLLAQSQSALAARDNEVAELRASAKAVERMQGLLEQVQRGSRRGPTGKSA